MQRIPRLAALTAGAVLAFAAPAAAQQACDPFGATFAGATPTAKQILGFDLGKRDVTTAESDRYLAAVDTASPRVVSGSLGKSVRKRDLRYAIVGQPGRLANLGAVRAAAAKLMDPATPAAEAAAIVANDPAILWIAGNVHGGEESGTDASLRVLYELADRTDCAALRILDEAIVVILPTQNPDGREADSRRNAYGFDMNRDWFARTQPETDAKVEFLRQYPPVLFIDAHEMGNTGGYFFPPNADPIYHEISSQAVGWINGLYGPAMQQVFDARKIDYFNYATYDLFYQGYGDTVPATGFGAAGMTFEKTSSDPTHKRVFEQYLTQWTSLSQAAANKDAILAGWRQSWVDALAQGQAGALEPNQVVQPENEIQQEVPPLTVRQYFIRADEPSRAREVQSLVRRLQRMDVEVRRLTAPARRPGLHRVRPRHRPGDAPGRDVRRLDGPAPEALGAGDAQRGHVRPVPVLLRRHGLEPAAALRRRWRLLRRAAGDEHRGGGTGRRAGLPGAARGYRPSVALYSMSPTFTRGIESSGWLRWLLDQWGLAYEEVSAADIAGGALAGHDVLLVPDGYATRDLSVKGDPYALKDLGPGGQAAIRDWVNGGGRYVGWLDGAVLASAIGISSATLTDAARRRHLLAGRADPRGGRGREPAARRRRARRCRRSGTRAT